MLDDSVMKLPLIHTPQRPPQPEVHTTGCPSQTSAGFGGALGGGGSPRTGAGGGGAGSALARAAPPPATAAADRVFLIKVMSTTPALTESRYLADITTLRDGQPPDAACQSQTISQIRNARATRLMTIATTPSTTAAIADLRLAALLSATASKPARPS